MGSRVLGFRVLGRIGWFRASRSSARSLPQAAGCVECKDYLPPYWTPRQDQTPHPKPQTVRPISGSVPWLALEMAAPGRCCSVSTELLVFNIWGLLSNRDRQYKSQHYTTCAMDAPEEPLIWGTPHLSSRTSKFVPFRLHGPLFARTAICQVRVFRFQGL